jgi:hypothetical protein
MRKVVLTVVAIAIAAAVLSAPASAFEGGGRQPSEAPLIAIGQHYTGQLNNHKDEANYGGYREVALYRLPPVTTRDVIVVDWHAAPFTESPGYFPICLFAAQGVDDFNWGTRFSELLGGSCYPLSGSGTARSEIVVQETNANSSYLEFYDRAERTNASDYETFPYDFSVEPILHYLSLSIPPVKRVSATGVIHASAILASGLPAPDGLAFNLAVSWEGGGIASSSAVSSGGTISFPLALPETAFGKTATFTVGHAVDATYQAATSPKLNVKIAMPKAPGPTPCEIATRHHNALARQYVRVSRHARNARGPSRAYWHRHARQVKRKLRAARSEASRLCAV